MVKKSIQVYSRLKRVYQQNEVPYVVNRKHGEFEEINFYEPNGVACNYVFRFQKIFDEKHKQEDIFECVAKPVINSVIEGFNGTIFAYGQTGSGKTYSITGCPKKYDDRGIIPRTLEYLFAYLPKYSANYSLSISYMEIYNEVVFDLLGKKHTIYGNIDKIPRVTILEDKKGILHIKNLKVVKVSSAQEALKLLIVGEINRSTSETVSNDNSSRSHCMFTIYLKITVNDTIKHSKLNIIDLAGSERVYKHQLNGILLREARHINLSLHYLEHVIMSLSENKKHVPYRNCMMTYLLKDSLTGNCLTVMLATLSTENDYFQETLSTCKFSQRVSRLTTEIQVNQFIDAHAQVEYLKLKIHDLENQLNKISNTKDLKHIPKTEQAIWLQKVREYLENDDEVFKVQPDLSLIQFCFKALKAEIMNLKRLHNDQLSKFGDSNEMIAATQCEEILLNLDYIPEREAKSPSPSSISPTILLNVSEKRDELFKAFMSSTGQSTDIGEYMKALENKYDMAKVCSETIQQCQENINYLRRNMEMARNEKEHTQLEKHLAEQQVVYKNSLDLLEQIRRESENLQMTLKKEKLKLLQNFKTWILKQKCNDDLKSFGDDFTNVSQEFMNNLNKNFPAQNEESESKEKKIRSSGSPKKVHKNDDKTRLPKMIYLTASEKNSLVEQLTKKVLSKKLVKIKNKTNAEEGTSKSPKLKKKRQMHTLKVDKIFVKENMLTESEDNLDLSGSDIKDESLEVDNVEKDAPKVGLYEGTKLYKIDEESLVTIATEDNFKHKNDMENADASTNYHSRNKKIIFEVGDSVEFKDYINTVCLTGNLEMDRDIVSFYRSKFSKK